MSETWVNSWVPSACAWTSWQKNSKKGNRREQEGTRMGPGGIGMCRSNQNVWLSGSWVLHSLSQVKQFCHLVYFSSSQKPSEGWRWAVVICGTTNSFSRGNKFLFCDISFKKYLILYSRRNESDRISKFFFYLEPDRASTVHLLENHEAANWSLRQGDEEVNKIKQWNDPLFIFSITFPAVRISKLFSIENLVVNILLIQIH